MKRKRQVEFSKTVIAEAFFKLLAKYPYPEITVSLIAAEAGVARNTFYRNFDSIESILIYKLDAVLDEAIKRMESIGEPTMRDLVSWRVELAGKNPFLIHIDSEPFLMAMFEKFTQVNNMRVLKLVQYNDDKHDPLRLVYHQAGIQATIKMWLKSGQKLPVNKIVDLIMDQLPLDDL